MSEVETVNVNARNVPKELRVNFKLWCIKNGFSIQDALIALMEIAIEKNVKLKTRVDRKKRNDKKKEK